ncbi:259_t:CDS:1, partial [Gigaspora margarita]
IQIPMSYIVRSSYFAVKLHPLNLPEILTEIFLNLAEDRLLYPTLFINKFWYSCAGPIIWRCAEFDKRNLVQFEKFKKVMRENQKPLYCSKLLRLVIHKCKISDRTLNKIAHETPNLQYLVLDG